MQMTLAPTKPVPLALLVLFLVLPLLAAAACSDDSTSGMPDSSADAGVDSSTATDSSAGMDSGVAIDSGPRPDATPANVGSPLAINLSSVTYYSRQWTFLDQTKLGGGFGYAATNGPTDGDGWVLSGDVGLFLNTGLAGNYPGGRYVALYDGEANFFTRTTIWGASGAEMPNDAALDMAASTPGRLILDVTPSNSGFVLSYDTISTESPVTNLRIVHEDYEAGLDTAIFHPSFIRSIERFATLRFMDMMRTNGSDQSEWADRPVPTDALQGTGKGVALEYLVALANRVHANPWFTIPHLASDDYVANFARLVRDELDPGLDVYVEYSNEVWNGGFEQYDYARTRGEAAGLGTDRDAADRYYCRRSVEIFDIFESEFTSTGREGLVRVIASQNSPYWALRMMDWEDPATGMRAIDVADYWAVAPYFCGGAPSDPGSVSALLDVCETSIDDTLSSATEIGEGARGYGVQLISYEGGQHIRNDGASEAAQTIYNLANDDARMGQLYSDYLGRWRSEVGGQQFALFSLISGQGTTGRWGILVAQEELNYPKYRAAMTFIDDNPAWW